MYPWLTRVARVLVRVLGVSVLMTGAAIVVWLAASVLSSPTASAQTLPPSGDSSSSSSSTKHSTKTPTKSSSKTPAKSSAPSSTPGTVREARGREAMDNEMYDNAAKKTPAKKTSVKPAPKKTTPSSTPGTVREARAREAMDDEMYGGTTKTAPKPVYKRVIPRSAILAAARRIENGDGPGWHRGRPVPYTWGGGHRRRPGPTKGFATSDGNGNAYDARTTGVDCSGFARWVYDLAYHRDVLHRGNTNNQLAEMHRDPHRHPGDLVFFGNSRTDTVHVGVYIGHGKMIVAPESHPTHMNVVTQPVSAGIDGDHIVGFYHGPTVRVRVRVRSASSRSSSATAQRLIDHNPEAARPSNTAR